MAEKKEEKEGKSSGFLSGLTEIVKGFSLGLVKGMFDDFVKQVQEKIYETEKRVLDLLFSTIILMVGVIFTAIAVIFLLSYYTGLNEGWGYLIMGVLLVIWAVSVAKKHRR